MQSSVPTIPRGDPTFINLEVDRDQLSFLALVLRDLGVVEAVNLLKDSGKEV